MNIYSAAVTDEDARAFVEDNPLFLRRPAQVYVYRILLDNEHDARYVHKEGAGGWWAVFAGLEL
jgi:hypothetical protein